jgi:cobalt-zinc-cadmium efflux system outer membrane protein
MLRLVIFGNRGGVAIVIAALTTAAASGALAGDAEGKPASTTPARALGRDEAIKLGTAAGPGVAVATAPSAGIGDAAVASRAALPLPPRLTLSAGERSGATGRGFEVSATAIVDVPTKGIGSARETTVRSIEGARDADVRRARLEAGVRAGVAWSRALEAKLVVKLRGASVGDADALAEYARRRVKAGPGQPIELALAEGDLGSARTAELDAEGMLVDSLAELRLSAALDANAAVDPVGDLAATNDELMDEPTALAAAERDNPDLQLAAANARLAGDEIRLIGASMAPAIGLGATFTRDGFGDRVVTGIVSIPLPFYNPAGFDAGRARIAADVAAARVQRSKDELKSAIHVAIHDREHTRELRGSLATAALPPLREALRIARAQVAAGTQDIALALLVRQRVAQAEEQYVRACGEVHRADLRFLRLIGRLPVETP